MQCRNCGTEIADKALICYRCGTATTEAKYKPVPLPDGRRSNVVTIVIALALLVALGIPVVRIIRGGPTSLASWVFVAVALVIVILRAVVRRRK